ncbi:MAG: 5-oxoprolinase subunit PxpA [Caldisericia bacterium]
MKKILINIDSGENFSIYRNPIEEELIKDSDLINIACGFHSGDPDNLRETVKIIKKYGKIPGAHPSYPDLFGFGRRSMKLSYSEIENIIIYQLGALSGFLKVEGITLNHVKPHGALYNDSVKDEVVTEAIGRGVFLFDKNLKMIGLSLSKQVEIWKKMGLQVLNEVYIDRAYNVDGTLVSREKIGSVITDLNLIEERIKNLLKSKEIITISGNRIKLEIDTICLHSDTPNSLEILKILRRYL